MRDRVSIIQIQEAAKLLQGIARGEIAVTQLSGPSPAEPGAIILRAGSYTLYLFEDDDGLGSFEKLVHDDGRTGSIDEWLCAAGHVPGDLLAPLDRMWFDAMLAVAQTLGATRLVRSVA